MFSVWLLSLSMFLKFMYVVICIITSLVFMDKKYPIVWICHILSICSSFDEHLECFPFNECEQWCYEHLCLSECLLLVLWGILSGPELLSHILTLCSTFEESTNLFFKQLHSLTFLPIMYEGHNFPSSSSALVLLVLGCVCLMDVRCYCDFDLHWP